MTPTNASHQQGLDAKMVEETREGGDQLGEGHLVRFPRILENNSRIKRHLFEAFPLLVVNE
jgi:hypothetical protein